MNFCKDILEVAADCYGVQCRADIRLAKEAAYVLCVFFYYLG